VDCERKEDLNFGICKENAQSVTYRENSEDNWLA